MTVGMLPKDQVIPQLVEKYKEQEKSKRKELMSRFINFCSDFKVLNLFDLIAREVCNNGDEII